jgi:hypothetical protein
VRERPADLPGVNTHMGLRLACCAGDLGSRVEGFEEGRLLLTAPEHPCGAWMPDPGTALILHWTAEDVPVEMAGAITQTRWTTPRTWLVESTGTPRQIQRREFFRARTPTIQIEIETASNDFPGWLLDISEGGLRCSLRRKSAPVQGEFVNITMPLVPGDPAIEVIGEVVRTAQGPIEDRMETSGGLWTMAVRFQDVSKPTADRLRRYVFGLQINERQRALKAVAH